jgi:hypothetical protein
MNASSLLALNYSPELLFYYLLFQQSTYFLPKLSSSPDPLSYPPTKPLPSIYQFGCKTTYNKAGDICLPLGQPPEEQRILLVIS